MDLAHTPYDGSSAPFTIGLKPLDPTRWIEPDALLAAYLDEKDALLRDKRGLVFQAEPETVGAQAEVFSLLADYLPGQFPGIYAREGDAIRIIPAGRTVAMDAEAPLLSAARLVQEDLCLMREGEGGYRLAAATLCFPSFWSLMEKFGRPMDAIHTTVPGYAERLGTRINRIFSSLRTEIPVERYNWSLTTDALLHHPQTKSDAPDRAGGEGGLASFIRVERQTLRRLPGSGDILFTIKVMVDPIGALEAHADGARLAEGLRGQLLALDADQLAYKGLLDSRDAIADRLHRIASGALSEPAGA
ncbi:hypothetical protein HDIA_3678 [Hartmannibacter diazotrophicus]|uniref:DUF3445 domain-containing protein n=1 Tax=Hartmannibacter diazotrophicus TaxID=1482074 RepID=A0A2C9DAL2_9HYPH|nr:DUF3445 domain-containing protein [Hartmannibacter diazotrophicus]SON57219.1 hypothetical protein HDIA_3678 [Hartmannibacter diazotrophicus]